MDARTSAIFSFLTGSTLFGQIWSKKKNENKYQNKTNLDKFECSLFPFLTGNTPFGHPWSKNSELPV